MTEPISIIKYAQSLIKHGYYQDMYSALAESKRFFDKKDCGLVEPMLCPHRPDMEISIQYNSDGSIIETHYLPLLFTDIQLNMSVVDSYGNVGNIIDCDDIHNIIVEYNIGGQGIYCLDVDCTEYEKLFLNI